MMWGTTPCLPKDTIISTGLSCSVDSIFIHSMAKNHVMQAIIDHHRYSFDSLNLAQNLLYRTAMIDPVLAANAKIFQSTDNFVFGILWFQILLPAALDKPLYGRLVMQKRHDNISGADFPRWFHYHQIAIQNPGAFHAVSPNFEQKHVPPAPQQRLRQVDPVFHMLLHDNRATGRNTAQNRHGYRAGLDLVLKRVKNPEPPRCSVAFYKPLFLQGAQKLGYRVFGTYFQCLSHL